MIATSAVSEVTRHRPTHFFIFYKPGTENPLRDGRFLLYRATSFTSSMPAIAAGIPKVMSGHTQKTRPVAF
jgi:hypothetical protein